MKKLATETRASRKEFAILFHHRRVIICIEQHVLQESRTLRAATYEDEQEVEGEREQIRTRRISGIERAIETEGNYVNLDFNDPLNDGEIMNMFRILWTKQADSGFISGMYEIR